MLVLDTMRYEMFGDHPPLIIQQQYDLLQDFNSNPDEIIVFLAIQLDIIILLVWEMHSLDLMRVTFRKEVRTHSLGMKLEMVDEWVRVQMEIHFFDIDRGIKYPLGILMS